MIRECYVISVRSSTAAKGYHTAAKEVRQPDRGILRQHRRTQLANATTRREELNQPAAKKILISNRREEFSNTPEFPYGLGSREEGKAWVMVKILKQGIEAYSLYIRSLVVVYRAQIKVEPSKYLKTFVNVLLICLCSGPNDGIMAMYVSERSREPSGTAFQPPDWPPSARLDGSDVFGFLELPAKSLLGYEDDETEDGPVDYPMDGGDDGDDDDGDSSRDDARDEDEDEEDEEDEEEEEHLAPADSTTVIPADEPVFPPEGTEPVIPPPSTDITIGARITVRPQTSISLPPEAEVERLLTMTTPSPSPPISLSPPSAGERLARCTAPPAHSPPLPPSSGCLTQIQTLGIASTQALIDAVTAALPPPPLPPLPPSLYIPPPVDRRDDIPESVQLPRKRLHLSTLGSRYEIGESSTARPTRGRGIDYGFISTVDAEERQQGIRDVGYGIRDTWVDPVEAVSEVAPMTVREVNTRVIELAELHEQDTQDLYALLEDAQDSRSRISQRVDMDSQRVDLLMGDRMTLQETVWMVEEEAYASREAWAHSIGLSQATHQELQTHRNHIQHQVHETRFQMQKTELAALRETDRKRQDQMRRARQPGPEARSPDHRDASGDADSHA
ncbi:hypothetical protein Tco_0105162 [Tanacetum coccineum]